MIVEERAVRTSRGLGDVTASVRYRVSGDTERNLEQDRELEAKPVWTVSGQVKLATGDRASGLGTGANDYKVGVDYSQAFRDTFVFMDVGYTRYGDTAELPLNDAFSSSVGLTRSVQAAWTGISLFAEEPVEPGTAGARELSIFYGGEIGGREFSAYLVRGLSESSPDWGYGVSMTFE